MVDIPLEGQLPGTIGLRRQLLRSIGIEAERGIQVANIKAGLAQFAPCLFHADQQLEEPNFRAAAETLSSWSLTSQFRLSHWILRATTFGIRRIADSHLQNDLPVQQIAYVLAIIEDMKDHATLATFLRLLIPFSAMDSLPLYASILKADMLVFMAMDVLKMLWQMCLERYQTLRLREAPSKEIIVDLASICQRMGSCTPAIIELNNLSQSTVVAVCTPASEGLLESSQDTPTEVGDEIERIFSSGTTMDRQSIAMVFETIVGRIASPNEKRKEHISTCALMLGKLKAYGEASFDDLMQEWLRRCFKSEEAPHLIDVASSFIGHRCLEVQDFVDRANSFLTAEAQEQRYYPLLALKVLEFITRFVDTAAITGVNLIALLDSTCSASSVHAHFFLRATCREYCDQHTDKVSELAAYAAHCPVLDGSVSRVSATVLRGPRTLSILSNAIVEDPDRMIQRFRSQSTKSTQPTIAVLHCLIDACSNTSEFRLCGD